MTEKIDTISDRQMADLQRRAEKVSPPLFSCEAARRLDVPVAAHQARGGRLMANLCVRPIPVADKADAAQVLASFTSRGNRAAASVAETTSMLVPHVTRLLRLLVGADELFMKVVDGQWAYGRVRRSSRGKGGER